MTVQWNEATPTVIPFQANIQAAIDCAKLNNLEPILAVYPQHPAAIGSNAGAQAQFATFVSLVGQAFPGVKDIIVGNEPNVNRFWQPQYRGGKDAAATDYEHTLAQSYDALKTVRPDAIVWGPAISSRGNDHANATSNPSHSPVWFIKYLGDAYRASGRTKPIFDEFDMHPYPPVQDSAPFSKPFQWPQAGAANLDRIKQALWDAFNGTAQPVPAEQAPGQSARPATDGPGLPINLDEVGEQTIVTGHEAAYTDSPENVVPITEQQQSDSHVQLAEIAACDPDVKALLYFPLIDDTSLSGGFQSGNLFADLTHKALLRRGEGEDRGLEGPLPGRCRRSPPGVEPHDLRARRPGDLRRPWDGRLAAGRSRRPGPLGRASPSVRTRATPHGSSGSRAARSGLPLTGVAKAYYRPALRFGNLQLPNGAYQFQIVLAALTNPARTTTLTSPTFTVGGRRRGATGSPAGGSPPRHCHGHGRHGCGALAAT